ncbi:MAG: hypothetical protein JKY23_04110 [Nitrospinaceae bacterium]|nr:hypothetical protein [Nitrospinaceae bacterium]
MSMDIDVDMESEDEKGSVVDFSFVHPVRHALEPARVVMAQPRWVAFLVQWFAAVFAAGMALDREEQSRYNVAAEQPHVELLRYLTQAGVDPDATWEHILMNMPNTCPEIETRFRRQIKAYTGFLLLHLHQLIDDTELNEPDFFRRFCQLLTFRNAFDNFLWARIQPGQRRGLIQGRRVDSLSLFTTHVSPNHSLLCSRSAADVIGTPHSDMMELTRPVCVTRSSYGRTTSVTQLSSPRSPRPRPHPVPQWATDIASCVRRAVAGAQAQYEQRIVASALTLIRQDVNRMAQSLQTVTGEITTHGRRFVLAFDTQQSFDTLLTEYQQSWINNMQAVPLSGMPQYLQRTRTELGEAIEAHQARFHKSDQDQVLVTRHTAELLRVELAAAVMRVMDDWLLVVAQALRELQNVSTFSHLNPVVAKWREEERTWIVARERMQTQQDAWDAVVSTTGEELSRWRRSFYTGAVTIDISKYLMGAFLHLQHQLHAQHMELQGTHASLNPAVDADAKNEHWRCTVLEYMESLPGPDVHTWTDAVRHYDQDLSDQARHDTVRVQDPFTSQLKTLSRHVQNPDLVRPPGGPDRLLSRDTWDVKVPESIDEAAVSEAAHDKLVHVIQPWVLHADQQIDQDARCARGWSTELDAARALVTRATPASLSWYVSQIGYWTGVHAWIELGQGRLLDKHLRPRAQ